jgi:hypothetical protein
MKYREYVDSDCSCFQISETAPLMVHFPAFDNLYSPGSRKHS